MNDNGNNLKENPFKTGVAIYVIVACLRIVILDKRISALEERCGSITTGQQAPPATDRPKINSSSATPTAPTNSSR